MKVLVVGKGGREHTLCWKIAQSPELEELYCAPGNPGMLGCGTCVDIQASDTEGLLHFVREEGIDLTVVGPETPLIAGLADRLREQGSLAYGPGKLGAQIEGSKIFAKKLMRQYGIPTAAFETFDRFETARDFLLARPGPWVVKADGEAAGKGAIVCDDERQALRAAEEMMVGGVFGESGRRIVLEERMQGEECSFMVVVQGETVVPLPVSQDHKRALEGDQGPNTGGMGAFSPVGIATPELVEQVMDTIVRPVARALAAEGIDYRGTLYPGLMLTPQGPKVVEFNCRFGDPETQVLLPRLKSDLLPLLYAAAEGTLANTAAPEITPDACASVALVSHGYPGEYETGLPIDLPEGTEEGALLFHAGTKLKGDSLVTAGGRVLNATALGTDLKQALAKAYRLADQVQFPGKTYRRDIGHRYAG
jgi:phosphoribosylamine--glycine ligase